MKKKLIIAACILGVGAASAVFGLAKLLAEIGDCFDDDVDVEYRPDQYSSEFTSLHNAHP